MDTITMEQEKWSRLPAEVQEQVLLCVAVVDLIRCRAASKVMERIILSPGFKAKYLAKHGTPTDRFMFEFHFNRTNFCRTFPTGSVRKSGLFAKV